MFNKIKQTHNHINYKEHTQKYRNSKTTEPTLTKTQTQQTNT